MHFPLRNVGQGTVMASYGCGFYSFFIFEICMLKCDLHKWQGIDDFLAAFFPESCTLLADFIRVIIFIMMSFHSSEFAWNSVDVRGDDGLLHNGRVIDVLDGGLVVHFGGTGHSGPKLFPFGQIYHRQYTKNLQQKRMKDGLTTRSEKREVEVLLRLQPEDPWKWYPGVLLDAVGLVSITLADRKLKGIVVEQRVRERSSGWDLSKLLVTKQRFSRTHAVVPSELAVTIPSDDQLLAIFNGHCRQRHYWMMATHVLINPYHGLFKELAVMIFDTADNDTDVDDEDEDDGYQYFKYNEFDWPLHHGIRNICCESLDELLRSLLSKHASTLESASFLSLMAPISDDHIQSLYRDPSIFTQIFECLTTVQQTKRRGVCKTWDAILTSAYIRSVITVSQPSWGRNYTRRVYRFGSCLYHCWTKHTRMLVFYGGDNPDECDGVLLADIARLLQRIRIEKGMPAVEVLLLTKEWQFNTRTANWVKAMWKIFVSLAQGSRQVVLKSAGIHVELQPTSFHDPDSIAVRFSSQPITRQLTVNDFWSILNNGLCDLDTEVERLSERIRSAQKEFFYDVTQILNITQTLDPRDGVRYSGMDFYKDASHSLDGIDVRHLTKLTVHALVQRFARKDHKICFDLR